MVDLLSIGKLVKEVGISIGVFCLCAWMVIYIVKRLACTIDKLATKIDKHEHESATRSAYVRKEHEEMIKTLSRINGRK